MSQHITDLLENSVGAGARRVEIVVEEEPRADRLTVRVADDGHGMAADLVSRALDPFWTTRSCRRVGLGLPLLAAAAQRCEGSLEITSEPGRGTSVTARFRHGHVDRPPLGNLQATLMGALVGHPHVDLHYRHTADGRSFELDGAAIKRELQGTPLSHPAALRWLERYIAEGLAEAGLEPTTEEEESDAKAG
ncbi:MAG: ATP-binding protein [Chloroflexota bacterium]